MFFGRNEKEQLFAVCDSVNRQKELLEKTEGRLDELEKAAGKHDIVLEDLSDTLAEFRAQEEETIQALHRELEAARAERLRREQADEEGLLLLLEEYEKQLRNLEALLGENEEWRKQFEAIRSRIRQRCVSAGITLLGVTGEPVNYELHEVLDVRETTDPELDKCIAQVYEGGYIYRDHIKKARVSAWKGTVI